MNIVEIGLNILRLFSASFKKEKERCKELNAKINEIAENHKIPEFGKINIRIMLSLLLFSQDPELVDEGKLFDLKRQFSKVGEAFENSNEYYKVNNTLMSIFRIIIQIQQIMGV